MGDWRCLLASLETFALAQPLQALLPAPFAGTSACPDPLPRHPAHLDMAAAGRVKSGLEEPQA